MLLQPHFIHVPPIESTRPCPVEPLTASLGAPAEPVRLQRGLMEALNASDNAIIVTNHLRRIVYVNDGFHRMLGFTLEEVSGLTPSEVLLGRHSDPALVLAIREAMSLHGRYNGEALVYGKGGSPRWVAMAINNIDHGHEGMDGNISILTDITLTKMHETLQQRVLESMVSDRPLPDLMQLVCREVERIAPEVTASILSVDALGRIHPLAAPSLPAHVSRALEGVQIGPQVGSCGTAAYTGQAVVVTHMATDPRWSGYWPLFADTGLQACWSSPIKNHQGQVIGTFAFYFHEPRGPSPLHERLVEVCLHLCALALERHAIQERLHQLAFYDVLTGLPNRAMFSTTADHTLQRLREQQAGGALVFLDLDRFKQVNDTQGHAIGDALLVEIARRLSQQLRPGELAGRLSGDEFVLLLGEGAAPTALERTQSILRALEAPVDFLSQRRSIPASAGVALFPGHGESTDQLLRHADQALRQAKGLRSPTPCLFNPDLSQQATERATLEQALREAIQQKTLSLHYQPQVWARAPQQLYGVEALARWKHPVLGTVSPDRFIPVAEESGLIHELTLWVLDEGCRQLKMWRSQGVAVPRLALNLSAQSFVQPGFVDCVTRALQTHGLSSRDVVLEITESVMMDTHPSTVGNVQSMHASGLQLSLDDFGTGYSSLSYLHRLPIHELKLDRSFVQDLENSRVARALTLSVLSIARSLHITVVAEGVETAEQAEWLASQGCAVLQGYHYARPMAGADVALWARQQLRPAD